MFGTYLVLRRIRQMEKKMSQAIADFAAAMSAFFDRQDVAVTAIQGDVQLLTDQIAVLANSAGSVLSASDQTLLDALAARAAGIATKLDALDAMTPPAGP